MSMKDPRGGHPSASNVERYFLCPGSFLLCKRVPEQEKLISADAASGSRIHTANEESDLEQLRSLDERELLERIRKLEEETFFQWRTEYEINDAEIVRERRIWLVAGGYRISGQVDFLAVSRLKRLALILDTKTGRKEVATPARNWQLRTQAILVSADYNISQIRVGIIQPLAKTQPLCDYDADSIYGTSKAWDQLARLLYQIHLPDAPRRAGAHCSLCDARHICPEAQALVDGHLRIRDLSWEALPPDMKKQLFEDGKIIVKIIEQVHFAMRQDVAAGLIPGYEISKPTFPRKVSSPIGAFERIAKEIEDDQFQRRFDEMTKLSIGALEDYIREWKHCTKKEATDWVNTVLAGLIETERREGHIVASK